MTLSCPGPSCPMCRGEACRQCSVRGEDIRSCQHSEGERHELPDDYDAIVVEASDIAEAEEPPESRVPTKPLPGPLLGGRIEVDFSNPEQVAEALETIARIARARGRIVIMFE